VCTAVTLALAGWMDGGGEELAGCSDDDDDAAAAACCLAAGEVKKKKKNSIWIFAQRTGQRGVQECCKVGRERAGVLLLWK
jgi:hypothetical protein